MNDALRQRIETLISAHPVVLFMKGTRHFPQCGFSGAVVQTLNALGARYETVNILADQELREGIKTFSDWPTLPQLYVSGRFVGGCDIVRELSARGELEALLRDAGAIGSSA